VDKALNYLWQRDQINKIVKIPLKEPNHTIENILELQVKLNACVAELACNRKGE
jgi:predicted peroxiredoxin